MTGPASIRLRLYTRVDCPLCEAMMQELQLLPEAGQCLLETVDVDRDPAERLRYGHRVPVLLMDGDLLCHGHFDLARFRKALAARR